MSVDLAPEPTDRLRALAAAREIIRQNPGATAMQLVALGYLEGRIALCQELRPTVDARMSLHEYDCICQRCGRRAGSRHALSMDAPPHGYFEIVCFHCSSTDDPRAA